MSTAIVWFRQDLRLHDNPAFSEACQRNDVVIPVYIFDEVTTPMGGAQRWWLHHSLTALDESLKQLGLDLCLRRGNPLDILEQLVRDHQVTTMYWNRCYEPAVIERDTLIKKMFKAQGVQVNTTNGSLLYEPWEIKNKSGHFFKVFTPFWRACLQLSVIPETQMPNLAPQSMAVKSELLDDWALLPVKPNWARGFELLWQPGEKGAQKKLQEFVSNHLGGYSTSRDLPAKNATSKLSPHLHFGEISPGQVFRVIEQVKTHPGCDLTSIERFLAEIGWREFSYHLLYHFPSLPVANFKSDFDAFPWTVDPVVLKQWQEGKTGYPIVDAGMRELWCTGYMQNRVRMIVASFLTKHLLIDWRFGASWFLDTLLDADLASNSASWQWVAGCGADAAPYFRIFNPVLQGEKFDPDGEYIRQWIPELKTVAKKWIHSPWMAPREQLGVCLGRDYPKPMVDHTTARNKALLQYQTIKK